MASKPDHAHWRGGSATDRLFILTVAIKGLDGALGVIGGFLLLFVKPQMLHDVVAWLTTHELSRNPHDFFWGLLIDWFSHLDVSQLAFASGYLMAHGAMKAFLAITLLLGRPWSYPVGSAFLGLFIAYTGYRLHLHWTWPLFAFLLFDMFTLAMVIREWRIQAAHQYRRQGMT